MRQFGPYLSWAQAKNLTGRGDLILVREDRIGPTNGVLCCRASGIAGLILGRVSWVWITAESMQREANFKIRYPIYL